MTVRLHPEGGDMTGLRLVSQRELTPEEVEVYRRLLGGGPYLIPEGDVPSVREAP